MPIDTAVLGYFKKRKELELAWNDANELGDIMLKMATYLSYIGDEIGNQKEQYEAERAKKYLEHIKKESASKAENLARSELASLRGSIAKLEITHKNGWSLVSIGQSRLRGLSNEAKLV
jgi:hypothetical protein